MKKRIPLIIGIFVLLIVAFVGYIFFGPSPDEVEPETATATPSDMAQVYGIDTDESDLAFTMENLPAFGEVSGTFGIFGGTIVLEPTDEGDLLQVNVVIDGGAVEVGSEIGNRLMVILLEAEEFPCGVFTGTSNTVLAQPYTEEQDIELTGTLDISGIANEVDVFATFRLNENGIIDMGADLDVDLREYGTDVDEPLQASFTVVATEDAEISGCPVNAQPTEE